MMKIETECLYLWSIQLSRGAFLMVIGSLFSGFFCPFTFFHDFWAVKSMLGEQEGYLCRNFSFWTHGVR